MRITEIPLLPDPDEATDWLQQELSNPAYREAEPTLFDRIARAVFDFLGGLFNVDGSGAAGIVVIVVIAIVAVVLLVVAFLIWGLPRMRARSNAGEDDFLFGEDADRSAAELRADAMARADAGDWVAAIVFRFRAVARSLAERGAVRAGPGATVHAFAREATRAFPDQAGELDALADLFDDVRYLRRPGTEEAYRRVVSLDELLEHTRPAALAPMGAEL